MIRTDDIDLIRCPDCGGGLKFAGRTALGRPDRGTVRCDGCPGAWPVEDGLPRLYREERVTGNDRLLRTVYNAFARLHDPAVRHVLPLLEWGSEASLRDGYMRRLGLGRLRTRPDGRPLRILEVGIGGGANLPLIRRDLPAGLPVEVWGVDLSLGMLAECRKRIPRAGLGDVRLLVADAHALPFADAVFDRVFHVGGIGGFRDPSKALAEMARVALPGTPIVVVDEQLDAARRNSAYHKVMFRLLTLYDPQPHCPRECLPPGAVGVTEEQVSRFYYCLTFAVPKASRAARTHRRDA